MCKENIVKMEQAKKAMQKVIDDFYCKNCPNPKLCLACYVPEWKKNCDKAAERYFAKHS